MCAVTLPSGMFAWSRTLVSRDFHGRAAQHERTLAEGGNYSPVTTKVNHFLANIKPGIDLHRRMSASTHHVPDLETVEKTAQRPFPLRRRTRICVRIKIIAIFQRTASLSKRPSRSGVPRLAVAGIRRIRHQLLASVKPSKQSCPFFFKNRPTVTGEEQRNTHETYMTQCQNR